MFCPNCGNEIKYQGAFCIHCGAKLAPFFNAQAEKTTEAPAAPAAPAVPDTPVEPAAPAATEISETPAATSVPNAVQTPQEPPWPAAPTPPVRPPMAPPQQPAAKPQPGMQPQPVAPQQPGMQPQHVASQQPGMQQPQVSQPPYTPPVPPAPQRKKSGKTGLIVAICVVAVAVIAAGVVFLPKLLGGKSILPGGAKEPAEQTAPVKKDETPASKDEKKANNDAYDLANYLIVEYEGKSPIAEAKISLDRDKLMRDVCADKNVDPAFLDNSSEPPEKVAEIYAALLLADPFVMRADGTITREYRGEDSKGLKNGDAFDVKLLYDEQTKSGFLDFRDAHVTVAGLEELEELDPFEGFAVTADEQGHGVSGDNFLSGLYNGPIDGLNEFYFNIEPYQNVQSGEEICVRLIMDPQSFADYFGVYPTRTEMTCSLDLPAFVTSFDGISKTALEEMKAYTKESTLKQLAELGDDVAYTDPACIGYAFRAKNGEEDHDENTLTLVFRSNFTYPGLNHAPEVYFYGLEFSEIRDTDDAANYAYVGAMHQYCYIGFTFMRGYADPWEYTAALREEAEKKDQSTSFGGEFGLYADGDGKPVDFTKLTDSVLAGARSYAADKLVKTVEEKYNVTVEGTPEVLGAYLIRSTKTDKPDNNILIFLLKTTWKEQSGVTVTAYVPFEYDNVKWVKNGLFIDNTAGPLYNTEERTIGFADLNLIHAALMNSGEKLGEIVCSDELLANVGQ